MANKRINDLQARSSADDTINIPVDDASQSWRVTGAQLKSYIQTAIAPLTTLGDILYAAASGVPTRLAGNTTTTKKILTQTGTGSVSAVPAWEAAIPALKRVVSKTANYTLDPSSDDVCLTNTSGGAFTVTLPDAATNAGKEFTIRKTEGSTNLVTIATAGSDTIYGLGSIKMGTIYDSVTLMASGTEWVVTSNKIQVFASYYLAANVTPGTDLAIKYDTKILDNLAMYATGTGLTTIPLPGLYRINVTTNYNGGATGYIRLWKSSVCQKYLHIFGTGASALQAGSHVLRLAAADTISIRPDGGGTVAGQAIPFSSDFSIARIGD